jgi:hypothetical protein
MKKLLVPTFLVLLVALAGSCKKSCYQCDQYCSYCELKSDSSVVYKICTNKFADHHRIDSIENTFSDTTFLCNILNNSVEVCDGPNAIAQGITYYEKEDYFCTPK